MKNILNLMRKEFIQLRRDPRLVVYILMMPLVLLILFGYALKLEPQNVTMALVDKDHSFFSNLIKTNIWSEGYFKLKEVADKKAMLNLIRRGKARAGLYIGPNFSRQLTDNNQPVVSLYVDGSMPSLATAMNNKSSAITADAVTSSMYFSDPNAPAVVIPEKPFLLDIITLFNPKLKETWFFLPGVIGVLIMQVTLILTSAAVVRERETHTLEQILVSPVRKLEFILGKVLPYMLISILDFYLILGLGTVLFHLPQADSQLALATLAVLYVSAMVAVGVAISTVSQTQPQAIFLSVFILIPSILLSGFIFPIEAMP
ncbi:MAG TPA: ABC transporter permease, partial [Gammaproteobacteria bacterium]|nr:ABC transporter permease [Gammaproteobacteria bacterium]